MSPDKPVFDDAAIERGVKAMTCSFRSSDGRVQAYFPSPDAVRAIVEAVLTPPSPEPEILVTEAMLVAGNDAWNTALDLKPGDVNYARSSTTTEIMSAIYRAMERVRLKAAAAEPAAQPAQVDGGTHRHRRKGDMVVHSVPVVFRHDRQGRRAQLPIVHYGLQEWRLHTRSGASGASGWHRRKGDA